MVGFLTSLLHRLLHRLRCAGPGSARRAHMLYTGVVAQARQPFFYATLGMKDSPESRLEMVMLHLALVSERLEAPEAKEKYAELHRALLETFIRDMDRTVRQMGFGDTGVARRVKHLAGMLHHRLLHYHAAWRKQAPPEETYIHCGIAPERLAAYAQATRESLALQPLEALCSGPPAWSEPQ